MNAPSGLFVDSEIAPPNANRYKVGQIVKLYGDIYKVTKIENVEGRGEITLRATSSEDRKAMPQNRAERRREDRELRLASKRRRSG